MIGFPREQRSRPVRSSLTTADHTSGRERADNRARERARECPRHGARLDVRLRRVRRELSRDGLPLAPRRVVSGVGLYPIRDERRERHDKRLGWETRILPRLALGLQPLDHVGDRVGARERVDAAAVLRVQVNEEQKVSAVSSEGMAAR